MTPKELTQTANTFSAFAGVLHKIAAKAKKSHRHVLDVKLSKDESPSCVGTSLREVITTYFNLHNTMFI